MFICLRQLFTFQIFVAGTKMKLYTFDVLKLDCLFLFGHCESVVAIAHITFIFLSNSEASQYQHSDYS